MNRDSSDASHTSDYVQLLLPNSIHVQAEQNWGTCQLVVKIKHSRPSGHVLYCKHHFSDIKNMM